MIKSRHHGFPEVVMAGVQFCVQLCGLEPPQHASEPPQLERESVSNPRRNRKFKDFDATLSSFNRFSHLNLLCEATPLRHGEYNLT